MREVHNSGHRAYRLKFFESETILACDLVTISPGSAYWVYADTECQITISLD